MIDNFVIDTIMTIYSSTDFRNENLGRNRFEIVSPKRFSFVLSPPDIETMNCFT